MNTRLNNVMCRCCASEGTFKDLTSKYHWMGEEEIYADMLKDCFDIYLRSSEENEDGGICEVCITQLRNASNFKKQVLHTERIFKKQLQNKLFKEIVKVEVPEQDNLESDDDHNVTEDYSEFDMSIKEESPVESKAKKRVSSTTTSRAKKAKMEVGESSKRNLQFRTSKVSPKTMKILKINPKCITKKFADAKQTTVKRPLASNQVAKEDCTNAEPKKTNPQISKIVNINKGSTSELKKQLHNIEQILTHSNATPIRSCLGFYSCCYCKSQFEKPSDLKAHTLQTHTKNKASIYRKKRLTEYIIKLDITGLKCLICQDNINSVELLMEHLNTNHDIEIHWDLRNFIVPFKFEDLKFQCYICLTNCYKFKGLLQHMSVHYQNYICETCSSGFLTLYQLKNHKKTHGQLNVKCGFCPLTFDDYKKRKYHEHSEHGAPLLLYKCHYCDEAFRHFHTKETHLREVHGVTIVIECKACGKSYSNRTAYKSHVRHHKMTKKHKCSLCDKSFYLPHHLKDHQSVHTKIKNFGCEICDKKYCSQKAMRAHMKTHENICLYNCVECGRNFLQEINYMAHLKMHADADCA